MPVLFHDELRGNGVAGIVGPVSPHISQFFWDVEDVSMTPCGHLCAVPTSHTCHGFCLLISRKPHDRGAPAQGWMSLGVLAS